MTKDELKAMAHKVEVGGPRRHGIFARALAAGVLRLLAQEAARGEVVEACPNCKTPLQGKIWQFKAGHWSCHACSAEFTKPARYQRLIEPEPQP